MKKFKLAILVAMLGFGVPVQAAENTQKNDKKIPSSHKAVMGDCSSMTGKEKGMCEKEMNNRDNNSTDRSRINKERDTRNDVNNRSESSTKINTEMGTDIGITGTTGVTDPTGTTGVTGTTKIDASGSVKP